MFYAPFILENYFFYHFIQTVNDSFAIFLFELRWGEICSEDGVKLFFITRGDEVYQWCIDISELHYFAWFCS